MDNYEGLDEITLVAVEFLQRDSVCCEGVENELLSLDGEKEKKTHMECRTER